MEEGPQNQLLDPFEVFIRLKRLGIKQVRVAKALRRSNAAITYALKGKNGGLLRRIQRFADRIERQRAA